MASFFKDKARGGKWTCQYSIPGRTRPGAKRGFDRRKDAVQWFADSGYSIETGAIRQIDKITVASWMKTWRETYCVGCQPNTIAAYKRNTEINIVPYIGEKKIAALRPDDVQRTVNKLAGSIAASTVRQVYACLSAAMRRAVHDGLIQRNPCQYVTLPHPPAKHPNFCTPEQIQAVIAAMEGSRYFMPVYLCIMLGLRRGEAMGLMWSDIDGNKIHIARQVTMEAVKVVCKQLKTERSARALDIPPALKEKLNAHRKAQLEQKLLIGPSYQDHGYICADVGGGVLYPNTVSVKAKEFLTQIGAPPGTHLHDLRHTYATLLYQAGYPIDVVADLLGHAGVGTAYKYYVGEDSQKKREAANTIEALYAKK